MRYVRWPVLLPIPAILAGFQPVTDAAGIWPGLALLIVVGALGWRAEKRSAAFESYPGGKSALARYAVSHVVPGLLLAVLFALVSLFAIAFASPFGDRIEMAGDLGMLLTWLPIAAAPWLPALQNRPAV
jgi:hypothetical protein